MMSRLMTMWMLMPLSMLLPPRADTAYRLLATIGSYFKKLCTVITRNQSECNAKCFCHNGSIPTRRTYGQTDEHNCIKRQTRPNNLSRFYALYWWKLLSYTRDPNKQTKKKSWNVKSAFQTQTFYFSYFDITIVRDIWKRQDERWIGLCIG